MVSAAVAGHDLDSIARAASEAIACPVAIAIPALGPLVLAPAGSVARVTLVALGEHAVTLIGGDAIPPPDSVSELVPVRIGDEVAGVVAVFGHSAAVPDRRAWLEAAAAAAAVASLTRRRPTAC